MMEFEKNGFHVNMKIIIFVKRTNLPTKLRNAQKKITSTNSQQDNNEIQIKLVFISTTKYV